MQARREIIWKASEGYKTLEEREVKEARLFGSRYRLQSRLCLTTAFSPRQKRLRKGQLRKILQAGGRREEVLKVLKKNWVLCGLPLWKEVSSMYELAHT